MIEGTIGIYKSIETCYLTFYKGDAIVIKLNTNTYNYIFKDINKVSVHCRFRIENLSKDKFIEMIKSKDSTIQCMIINIILNNKI